MRSNKPKSNSKSKAKTFTMWTLDGLVESTYSSEFTYRGYDCVVHRPLEQTVNWNVSEVSTGRIVGRTARTRSDAIELAKENIDRHFDHMPELVEKYRLGGKV